MKNQKGFVWLPILLVILGVLAISGGAYYVVHQNLTSKMSADEVAQQPDQGTSSSITASSSISNQPGASSSNSARDGDMSAPDGYTGTQNALQTYTNAQYGFSVQYPVDITYTLSNPGRISNGSVSFSLGSGQSNSGSGRLDMGFPLPSDYCNVPKTDASHKAPTDLRIETIGGINFSVHTNTSAPPTESFKEIIFQGLHNSDCFFFSEEIMGGSVLNSAQIQAKLDAIVQSFKFIGSSSVIYKTITNTALHISFEVPQDWIIVDHLRDAGQLWVEDPQSLYKDSDGYSFSLSVGTTSYSNTAGIVGLLDFATLQSQANSYTVNKQNGGFDSTYTKIKNLSIDSYPAVLFLASGGKDFLYNYETLWIQGPTQNWFVTFEDSTYPQKYPYEVPIEQAILASIHVTP